MRALFRVAPAVVLIFCAGCGEGGAPGKPDLPASVTPGWTRQSYDAAQPPAGLPAGPAPQCWKAVYSGLGNAEVWACAFAQDGSAFDAAQRANVGADAVKFQEGKYLIVVKWSAGSRADLTALVRGIQGSFPATRQ